MNPRISMITLGVKNLEKSIEFYKEGLGFPVFQEQEAVAFFELNGSWLGLYGIDALAADANLTNDASGFKGFSLAHNLASIEEVDQLYAEALNAGAQAVKHPEKVFWGGYSGYFSDPDGYLWEIAYNPYAWIGPKDE